MPVPIGIANSVAAEHGFSPTWTVEYARKHRYEAVQIYLNPALDEETLVHSGALLRKAGMTSLCHWPDTFCLAQARDPVLLARTRAFFGDTTEPWRVVVHFDGRLPEEETGKAISLLTEASLVACVENTFYSGEPEASRSCLERLLGLLGGDTVVVIDIPRFWCSRNGPVDEALDKFRRLTERAAETSTPVILHLIDVTDNEQPRTSWVPMGKGLIPWSAIGSIVAGQHLNIEMAIFEYETPGHAEESRVFLEKWLRSCT